MLLDYPVKKEATPALLTYTAVAECGRQSIAAGIATIDGLEEQITTTLGERGHRQLRTLLSRLLKEGQIS